MIYKIRFTENATDTYQAIKNQLANRWNNKIVSDFEQRVLKFMRVIQTNPYSFPTTNIDPSLRKGFIHKNCSVYYEVADSENIVIHYFWDNRQEPIF